MAKMNRALERKYVFRRCFLTVVSLAILGVGAWFLLDKFDVIAMLTSPGSGVSAQGADDPDDLPQVHRPSSAPSSSASPAPVSSEPDAEPVTDPEDEWRLMLVSAANPLPDGYTPELEVITENYSVDVRIASELRAMIAAARMEGVTLMICSAYRTPEYQQVLFDRQVDFYKNTIGQTEEDAVATAATIVAYPGTSEHHTGLAVDIVTPEYQVLDDGFAATTAAKWMAENSWKYGFILRYPKDKQEITKIIYEPWHFRYVGEVHAAVIKEKAYCLEEYLYLEMRQQTGLNAVPPDEQEPSEQDEELPGDDG